MKIAELKLMLDSLVDEYNRPEFIDNDPISIPHQFSDRRDIEISGFWVAMLAWGQRKTIINKAQELINLMDGAPYDFIMNHEESDLARFETFKHRTFQYTDTLYFIDFFRRHYSQYDTLETAFIPSTSSGMYDRLSYFHEYFFDSHHAPQRTRKHVSTPVRASACKRLNMFLRWMVRRDDRGVDFGLWEQIDMSELMMPLDVHVYNVAKNLKLLKKEKSNWKGVEALTKKLRRLDPSDPVKYDYALFSLGVEKLV